MFALSASQRYFLYHQPVDMRKAFDGLCGVVQQGMGKDACCGDVYIFLGKRLDRMKLLVWEPSGFLLYYKRLEAGTFRLPSHAQQAISISYSELCLLVEGLDVEIKYRRKRFEKPMQKV